MKILDYNYGLYSNAWVYFPVYIDFENQYAKVYYDDTGADKYMNSEGTTDKFIGKIIPYMKNKI